MLACKFFSAWRLWLAAAAHLAITVALLVYWIGPALPYHVGAAADSTTAADKHNRDVLWGAAGFHIALAAITYAAVTFVITPPFGRHAEGTWMPWSLPSKLSWALQESPTVLNVLYFILVEYPRGAAVKHAQLDGVLGAATTNPSYGVLVRQATHQMSIAIFLFVLHYTHRSFIYPLRIPARAQRVPLHVTWSASLYCLFNGRLQVLASVLPLSTFDPPTSFGFIRCLTDHRCSAAEGSFVPSVAAACLTLLFVLGSFMFAFGMYVNMRSDYYLVELRRRATGYQIPRGGLFEYVSCPNFLGEVVEWAGYALVVCATTWVPTASACWCSSSWPTMDDIGALVYRQAAPTAAALSFVIYVLANLLPRGRAHHAWYLRHFGDTYARLHRHAVVPLLY